MRLLFWSLRQGIEPVTRRETAISHRVA